MKTIIKYRLCQIRTNTINRDSMLSFAVSDNYEDVWSYATVFDTKEEAIEFAKDWNDMAEYVILECYSFGGSDG